MKYIFLPVLLFVALVTKLSAQQNHFAFIQSETRQPFNITFNKKVYSSTATGYLIIPKLTDGQYNVTVGFGGNTIPDQPFNFVIEKKDVGFNLKNFGEKGWGLFNLQTFAVTMAGDQMPNSSLAAKEKAIEKTITKAVEKTFRPDIDAVPGVEEQVVTSPKGDIQSVKKSGEPKTTSTPSLIILSDTVKQRTEEVSIGSVSQTPVIIDVSTKQLEEKKENTIPLPVITKDNSEVVKEIEKPVVPSMPKTLEEKTRETYSGSPISKSKISKISELNGAEAFYITYVDVYENSADTIQLLIPNAKIADSAPSQVKTKDAPRFLDTVPKPAHETAKTLEVPGETKQADPPISIEVNTKFASRCGTLATEDDFLKLRKKMAAASDNDAMVFEAKKTFKIRCFSTTQVKNLAYLFLTDEARYHFFDAAYPYVSDPAEFSPLSIMLTDAYYINRFKAMLLN